MVRQVAVPPVARGRSTLSRPDYEDAFVLDTGAAHERTGEEWARALLEDAPAGMQRSLRRGWCALGLLLGSTRDERRVLGWEVRRRAPEFALLGADSRLGMVGEVLVKKGQRVGLFYSSANFDEDVFEDPHTFNILRDPNPHLAFGGHGAHYCIGANLARQEIRLIFNALADHVPDIHLVEEPRRLRHGWVNGIKEMRVSYS